jgi:hypothetical protein
MSPMTRDDYHPAVLALARISLLVNQAHVNHSYSQYMNHDFSIRFTRRGSPEKQYFSSVRRSTSEGK